MARVEVALTVRCDHRQVKPFVLPIPTKLPTPITKYTLSLQSTLLFYLYRKTEPKNKNIYLLETTKHQTIINLMISLCTQRPTKVNLDPLTQFLGRPTGVSQSRCSLDAATYTL